MTQDELKARIEKKEADIVKLQKRVAKWEKAKSEEGFLKEYDWYISSGRFTKEDAINRFYDSYIDDCNYELRRAQRDLDDAQVTLDKYKSQLTAKAEFNTSEKIPVIWDFLQEWREDAYNYFITNAKEYYELRQHYNEELRAYMESLPSDVLSNWRLKYNCEKEFEKKYYRNIHPFTKTIALYHGGVDEERLNKELDREVEAKYKNLVARIQEKAGDIVDATGLYIGGNGEINGVVIGTKNKVRVETITAGGYNQDVIVNDRHGQILHFRVLVHIIK